MAGMSRMYPMLRMPLMSRMALLSRLVLGLVLLCGLLITGAARADQDFLDPEQAFADSAAMAGPLALDLHWQIAPGYYMYQDRFEVRIEDAQGGLLLYRLRRRCCSWRFGLRGWRLR